MPARREVLQPEISRGVRWFVTWWVEQDGVYRRIRRSRTYDGINLNSITDLQERENAARQLAKDVRLRLCPPARTPDQVPFLEALQIAVQLKHSNKAKTNKTFGEVARWMADFFTLQGWQHIRCGHLELSHVQAYFDYCIVVQKVRNTTHNTRKNNLRSLFSELVQRGYLRENFVKQVQDRVEGDPLRRPFSEKERKVVAAYLKKHDRPLWLVYLLLGYLAIRPGEIRDLRIHNLDLKRGMVIFPGEQSKNRRNSVVTIPDDIIPELQSYHLDSYPEQYYVFGKAQGRHNCEFRPGPERVGVNTLSGRFRQVLRTLHLEGQLQNIRGLSLYSLKDSLAIYLLEQGVDVESAMRHFRHSSLEMFQRYVKRLGVENEKIRKLPVELP